MNIHYLADLNPQNRYWSLLWSCARLFNWFYYEPRLLWAITAYWQSRTKAITGVFSYFSLYSLRKEKKRKERMTCPAPRFEFRILAVCLNSCAYLENRKHYWNHIYTWAVGGSCHLNDSNFPTIWINVTNAVFRFGIGCLQTAGTSC